MATKMQLARLRDVLEEVGDLGEVVTDLMDNNLHLEDKVLELRRENERLRGLLEEYGIDPRENRLWVVSAVQNFVRSLGI